MSAYKEKITELGGRPSWAEGLSDRVTHALLRDGWTPEKLQKAIAEGFAISTISNVGYKCSLEIYKMLNIKPPERPEELKPELRKIDADVRLQNIFGKPDYSHIVRNSTIQVELSAEEQASILEAYDYGIRSLDESSLLYLEKAINKLKDEIHP